MSCPMCGSGGYQEFLGCLGSNAYIRCGACGWQYQEHYSDIDLNPLPVRSNSEWGSFRYDGDADMKVLRKRAEGAVRFFNDGKPRKEMMTNIFGYPFSIIEKGRLVDREDAHGGNVIIRCLSYKETGFYGGCVTLSYNDDYNDGRGQGGAGSVLIGKVTDVYIDGDYLVIEGKDLNKPKMYRYRIQDRPDEKPVVKPVPKGGKAPKTKTPVERKEPPRPKPKKEAPKKDIARHQKPKKGELVYEVRVGDQVKGSFSSRSKAEMMKKELKADGHKARVVGVFV